MNVKRMAGSYCCSNTVFSTCSSNSTDELPCSGNGECACGKCVCKAVSEQNNHFEMLVRKKKLLSTWIKGKGWAQILWIQSGFFSLTP